MIRKSRFLFVCAVSFFAFGAVVARLGWLQVIDQEELARRAKRQEKRGAAEVRLRGSILDRQGSALAVSIQGGSCFADPKRIGDASAAAHQLSPWLHIPAPLLKAKLQQKKRFVWLARRLDPTLAAQVHALSLPGITVQPEMRRYYPEDKMASHVLGVTGEGQDGLSGVELVANRFLEGHEKPMLFQQWDEREEPLPMPEGGERTPHSIVLAIDRTLQMIVEQELAAQMKVSNPKSGTVIVQDPATGEILAFANAPSFSPNLWGTAQAPSGYGAETLKNAGVEHVFEPGSTFKMVTAAAALEDKKIRASDSIFCEYGQWKIAGRQIHDHEKDGWLTFTQVMSHSSNIGTAKVAAKVGAVPLYRYARAFGFGAPTGIGLPGDGSGILRPVAQWSASSLETISFGQEVGVTALQMVNAYSALANGGVLLEPILYKGYVDDDRRYREWTTRRVVRRIVSPQGAARLREIFHQVVEDGTGKAARVPGLTVAGKTGTAQKFDSVTRSYHADHYIASFCGFAPVDKPRLVIGVFLDEPKGGSYWGGSEAAPLFARILRHAAAYLKIQDQPVGPLAQSHPADQS